MKQHIEVTVCMFRFGLRAWQDRVNGYLNQGWKLQNWYIEHRWLGLRLICAAVVEKPE